MRETRSGRVVAGVVAVGCLLMILLAAGLSAASAGHGTHEQLGLPPCGWVVLTGKPCITCGMTTAFSLAADGDFAAAFHAQPMGFVMSLAVATAFWVATYVAVTGSQAWRHFGVFTRPRVLWTTAGLFLAAWVYKIITF